MAKNKLLNAIKADARADQNRGAVKLSLIMQSIAHMDGASGDWTNLAWIVSLASATDKSRIKAIIKAACGCSVVDDPKQPSGMRVKFPVVAETVEVSANVWTGREILAAMVERNVSFRSKVITDGIEADEIPALIVKETAIVDIFARYDSLMKAMLAEGYDVSDCDKAHKLAVMKYRDNDAA